MGLTPTGGDAGCTTTPITFYSPGWRTGGVASGGYNSSMTFQANQLSTDGTYFYFGDTFGERVVKIRISDGSWVGWTGMVASATPTGGTSGCAGLPVGAVTPGWCLGGSGEIGSALGAYNDPEATYYYNSSVYVADTAGTLTQISAATGAPQLITGATISSSSGYVTTGFSGSGSSDGTLLSPQSLASDGSYLYVMDTGNNRIARFTLSSGVFSGWVGRVGVAVTGGSGSCTTAPLGYLTPGWCTGGRLGEWNKCRRIQQPI